MNLTKLHPTTKEQFDKSNEKLIEALFMFLIVFLLAGDGVNHLINIANDDVKFFGFIIIFLGMLIPLGLFRHHLYLGRSRDQYFDVLSKAHSKSSYTIH